MIRLLKKLQQRNKLIADHISKENRLTFEQIQTINLDDRDDLIELIELAFKKEKEVNQLRSAAFAWKKIARSNLDENLQTAYHLHKSDKYIQDLEDYNNELNKLLEEKCSQEELKFVYDFVNFDFDRSLRLPDEDLVNQNNELTIKELRKEIAYLKSL